MGQDDLTLAVANLKADGSGLDDRMGQFARRIGGEKFAAAGLGNHFEQTLLRFIGDVVADDKTVSMPTSARSRLAAATGSLLQDSIPSVINSTARVPRAPCKCKSSRT